MRVSTGLSGLDEMVQGGLPLGSAVVLQGPPGQEKMRLALTFLADGLKAGASGLVVIASQSPDSVLTELRNLGVDLDAVVKENRLRIVDWYSQREEPVQDVEERGVVLRSSIDLTNVGVALSRAIAALGGDQPKRAVVELLSPAASVYEVSQVYAFAQSSKGKFVRFNYTALVLLEKEMHAGSELSTLHQPFDGVIELERVRVGDEIVRKIGVLHLKDTTPDTAFRVLEMSEDGLRVVREASRKAPPGPPPKPPVARPSSPPSSAKVSVTQETPEESPTRAYLIMQIARERLKLNPDDADALFATAAAQATLDDVRGALEALERLSKVDDRYPGLWVLKTKLHARLGQVNEARVSRKRAEESEASELEAAEIVVACPLCETPVSENASRCPKCGAKFLEEEDIADELDALGQVAIQEKVQEELQAKDLLTGSEAPARPAPGRPAPPKPTPAPQVTAPPKEGPKPSPRQGMTNGLVKGRGPRAAGMTNGLRGRTNGLTNGLRGRTNGLTNGLRGRTNGLTNGLGHTNGLTNGMGRTNGLTNGLGRTNGVTNGLTNGLVSLRRGLTNGLTNGNGFTNGLGSPRFQREVRLNRWKLYVIPVVAVSLLLLPLFTPPDYAGRLYPIQIDGSFSDWPVALLQAQERTSGLDPDVDIQRIGIVDNERYLAFYVEVAGQAFAGGGFPARYDTLRIFLDTDRNRDTGYSVEGMGADRLFEISGRGGQVGSTVLKDWDSNRAAFDWNGWIKPASVPAASAGASIEFEADWDLLTASKTPVFAYAHFQSYDGTYDESDYVFASEGPSLVLDVSPVPAERLTGANQELLRVNVRCFVAPCSYSALAVEITGTAPVSSVTSVQLYDGYGSLIQQRAPSATQLTFQFPDRLLTPGQEEQLSIRADVSGGTGETLGLLLRDAGQVILSSGAATVRLRPTPRAVGYLGSVPTEPRVDGGFSEWTNVSSDPLDSSRGLDVDIRDYAFRVTSTTTSVFLSVWGRALNGSVVPQENDLVPASPGSGPVDSDRDTVPDSEDPMPYDFNNDGIIDAASSQDYDGDGLEDYPTGPDLYLNTTIPSNFPAAYANRPLSLYIGPTFRPIVLGEDIVRVFFDADNASATGFRTNTLGADVLLEVRGRKGVITHQSVSAFTGLSQLDWTWSPVAALPVATDFSKIEAAFASAPFGITNASGAYFEVMDWTKIPDGLSEAAFRISSRGFAPAPEPVLPGTLRTSDLAGSEKWFFTNTNSAETVCTTNKAASTTAGASAASTTLSSGQSICWYSPNAVPDTVAGVWEVILDIDKTTDAAQILSPNGNGATNAWVVDGTGCTGEANEWQCVDETPNDGDTTYIKSTASVTTDSLFNVTDWSAPSPLSVVNVGVEASCRKIAAAGVAIAIIIKSGATTSVGASGNQNCVNSATYTVWSDTWTTDPADGGAWTAADINALQVGVRDADAQAQEARASHLKVTVTFVPVYSVEINKCANTACTTTTNLYPATNFNSYGTDVTIQTGTIGAQTLTGQDHIQWKISLVAGGTVTLRYNGANPGTDDSRATVPIPEFETVGISIVGTVVIIAIVRHARSRRRRDDSPEFA